MCYYYLPPELFLSGKLSPCTLARFRTDAYISDALYAHLLDVLAHAKSVSVNRAWANREEHRSIVPERWLHDLLRRNQVIEELKLECLSDASPVNEIATSLSLRKLDLSQPDWVINREATLHFPNLRELTADARIVSKLSVASTSNLEALHLSVKYPHQDGGVDPDHQVFGPSDIDGFERVQAHTGVMTLVINSWHSKKHVSPSMRILETYMSSTDVIWPGLARVEVHFGDTHSAEVLLRLNAARTAGALGATREQYESIARGIIPITDTGLASGVDSSGPPLCKKIHWYIHHRLCLPATYVNLLGRHNNIHFVEDFESWMKTSHT